MDNLDLKQKMEIILNVGKILAENGATTDRIIRNSKRLAAFMKIPEENFNLHVTPSAIFLNIFDGEKSNSSFKNLEKHAVDLDLITAISNFTWNALKENYLQEQFQEILNEIINRKKNYSQTQNILATGIFCGGFCFLFGGDIFAAFYAAICAASAKFFQLKFLKLGVNHFITIAIAAFVATVVAFVLALLPSETPSIPIIACALFLIPGVPIINATIDTLNNFLLNGMTKAFQANIIAISMTVGIVFAIAFCIELYFFVYNEHIYIQDFLSLEIFSTHNFFEILIAAIVVTISFSIMMNISRKTLIYLGILGAITVVAKNFLILELNLSAEIATFFAATVAGILAIKFKKFTRTPMQVLIVPAIISMVPGVLIYRFLFSCINIKFLSAEEFFLAMETGIDALQIIFAMVVGAILPSLIANKIFERKYRNAQEKYLNNI